MGQTNIAEVDVRGNVSGQVAVGNHILQLGNINGGIVNIALSSTQLSFKRRGGAVNLRPRREKSFLDRQSEIKTIKNALKSSKSVLVVGAGGIGKTILLHQAANLPETRKFRDGVVFLDGSDRGRDDVLQFIFQTFYQSRANVMPTEAQIRQNLSKINALILLDDLRLTREEVTVLLDILPKSTFVLTSRERTLWGDQEIISLGGLPEDDAVKLFARELKRPLKAKEKEDVRAFCTRLGGHPLNILYEAAAYREKKRPIAELQSWIQKNVSGKEILQSLLDTLDETEKSLLSTLGAIGRAVIPLEHIKALSKDKNVKKRLKKLMSLRLIQSHSPRFSLTDAVADSPIGILDVPSQTDSLIDYFVNWLAQGPSPALLEESADALVQAARKAGEREQWKAVIQIGQGMERILALTKRWQTWADILNLVLKAARALGDAKVEAWALHQSGCRAMCIGLGDQAQDLLRQALNIRQAIGDQDGLAVTQHNLDALLNPPLPKVGKPGGPPRWLSRGFWAVGIAIASAALAIGGYKLLPTFLPAIGATPSTTYTLTSTPTNTLTPTATNTFTPIPSRAPAPTATQGPLIYGPDPEDFPVGINPLTGLLACDPALLQLPAVLVSITHFPSSARPQAGLSFAPMIFEIYIAEGETRFLAVFYGECPHATASDTSGVTDQIGPIRSGRKPYLDIHNFFQWSCLVYASATEELLGFLPSCKSVDGKDSSDINSALLDVTQISKIAQKQQNAHLNQPFNYTGNVFSDIVPSGGQSANSLNVYYSNLNRAQWSYDPVSGKYLRSENYPAAPEQFTPATDRLTGQQLALSNIIVLLATHTADKPTIIDIDLGVGTGGYAYLFRDGKVFKIRWTTMNGEYEKKTGLRRPIRFTDETGNPIALKPGNTWIHVITPFSSVSEQSSGEWLADFSVPAGAK